ncbi:MAG TPA: trypsin-like peptidase domain-containing protein, partial [Bacillota bacterium]|nr:trypsin-like peptidase domain-containing protein [Bacillota bacterium]
MNQFKFDSHDSYSKLSLITIALISGALAAFLMLVAIKFTGLGTVLMNPPTTGSQPALDLPTSSFSINDYEKSIIKVYNRVKPSVVMITTDTLVEEYDFFSGPSFRNVQGLGSGVVFRQDGYILTNKHVVGGVDGRKVNQISVVLSNGKTYSAKIVGVDTQI